MSHLEYFEFARSTDCERGMALLECSNSKTGLNQLDAKTVDTINNPGFG